MLGAVATLNAQPAADIRVDARTRDSAVEVTARAVLHAPLDLIWQTLTDYEDLPKFVPCIASSRVVSRQGARSIIEQTGDIDVWFFSYAVHVTVASTERPFQGIDVHLVQGNLRRLDGGYLIVPRPDGSVELTWSGLIEPETPLPAFIRTAILRHSISEQFADMVREIERRADARSARPQALH
jgi:ribosome-associated toxin RatA of RatAB toxin-antitoxin module